MYPKYGNIFEHSFNLSYLSCLIRFCFGYDALVVICYHNCRAHDTINRFRAPFLRGCLLKGCFLRGCLLRGSLFRGHRLSGRLLKRCLLRGHIKLIFLKMSFQRTSYPMSKSMSVAAELHVVEPLLFN